MKGEEFTRYIRKIAQKIFGQEGTYKVDKISMEIDRKSHYQVTYRNWVLAGVIILLLGSIAIREKGAIQANMWESSGVQGDMLSGSLRLAGSSSMEEMASMLAEGFMEQYPEVSVTIEYVGSAAGIEAVLNGSADIGNSSRNLKEEELARGAVENIVAMDGIAVCVDPANKVTGLTREQLAGIYTGLFTNWSELGGDNVPIVVVGHEAGSGTRDAFEEILGIKDKCVYANELNSMGAVKARTALIPGAIGYLSFEVLDDSVKALWLDGMEPNIRNVENNSYPLCRPFVMVTKGEISEQSELIQAWFAYIAAMEMKKEVVLY